MLAEGSHEITLTLHYPLAHALTKGFRACVPLRRICGLCKGLYHHNGVWHESTRPQIHRFRPQARAPPLGACLHHQRCGDGEVSGSGVSEGVSEAPTFMEWCARWWCRPTLKVAATPCRCASTTIRLCESATLSGCQRLEEHGARDCSGRFG